MASGPHPDPHQPQPGPAGQPHPGSGPPPAGQPSPGQPQGQPLEPGQAYPAHQQGYPGPVPGSGPPPQGQAYPAHQQQGHSGQAQFPAHQQQGYPGHVQYPGQLPADQQYGQMPPGQMPPGQMQPAPGQPPQQGYPGPQIHSGQQVHSGQAQQTEQSKGTPALAVVALAIGAFAALVMLLGWTFIHGGKLLAPLFAIPAIVTGHFALVQARRRGRGKGLALTGLLLGYAVFGITVLILAVFIIIDLVTNGIRVQVVD